MTVLRFTVPGEPVTWKRARRGHGHSYTDPVEQAHREKVRAYARNAGIRRPLEGALRLDVVVFTSLPVLDERVGDEDNYRKLVKDALNRIAYADDRQVCAGWTEKQQDADRPRTEVSIASAEERT